jgi:hypothetical protein
MLPPFSFAILLSQSRQTVVESLRRFRSEWNALLFAERSAHAKGDMWTELLQCMYWREWPAVRALFLMVEASRCKHCCLVHQVATRCASEARAVLDARHAFGRTIKAA